MRQSHARCGVPYRNGPRNRAVAETKGHIMRMVGIILTTVVAMTLPGTARAQDAPVCDDFDSQEQAQIAFDGTQADDAPDVLADIDVSALDPDGDGIACENWTAEEPESDDPDTDEQSNDDATSEQDSDEHDTGCQDVPPALVGRITAQMEYFDVWLQGAQAVQTYEFGPPMWIVSADIGGPEFQSNTNMAHWLSTDLDADQAQLMKIDQGHADYLSGLPSAGDNGYDIGFLSEALGQAQECAMDAAEQTGALGVDRETWEERHGETDDRENGFSAENGTVTFQTADDRITRVTVSFEAPVLARDARAVSRDFIPDDALLTGTSAEGPREVFNQPDLYTSEWLSDRFGNDQWQDAEPGTLSVMYNDGLEGFVSSITIQIGRP